MTLTEEERRTLERFVHRDKTNACTHIRAHPASISGRLEYRCPRLRWGETTVIHVRRGFAEVRREMSLHDKAQQHRYRALSGLQTAHLIGVACSYHLRGMTTEQYVSWREIALELGCVTNISPTTIHELLKNELNSQQLEH